MRVTCDYETRSHSDISLSGTAAYSEHPTTEPICFCYAIDDGPVQDWLPGMPFPDDLRAAIAAGAEVEAHNAAFEISIWENVMVPRFGWPAVPRSQWRDSMSVSCYYALPAKLDRLAAVLGFGRKDPEGARLISKYSKLYLKTAKPEIPPDDLAKFVAYCRQDVELERAISNFLGDLPAHELEVFQGDLEMNLRGLKLNLAGIAAASNVVEQRRADLKEQFRELTGGLNPTQRDKVMAWLDDNGLSLENMKKETLEELLDADGDDALPQGPVRRALEIRMKINKASTDKLRKMAACVNREGRALFQSRYHGAATGRPTGDGFQPLNLSRGFEDADEQDAHLLVQNIMLQDPEWLDMLYGDAMEAVSMASRHWIEAAPGHRLIAGDYSSIEAIVGACLAGEDWKVQAFREGKGIYGIMGAKIHKLDPALADNAKAFKKRFPMERQDGKTGELAFLFQGSLGAWLRFDRSGRHSDKRILEINKAWRAEHPMTTQAWRGVGEAALEAAMDPGKTTNYRDIGFQIVDEWLSMILPDGKRLWYWKPEVNLAMPKWHTPNQATKLIDSGDGTMEEVPNPCASGDCRCVPMATLSYWTQKTGQWKCISTYGGHQFQNAVQATARQIMEAAKKGLRRAGYPLILGVYDEALAEVRNGFGSKAEFLQVMEASKPAFAKDWPIKAEGFEGAVYRK